ncbi:2-amino-4-hydroxy-6-hydroxymethyldihydropteridine diphosphokinase [Massilia sp. TS11]|uniref:2-amino-4-hydroxy-6- hydroxymethyldihydropteridine diphosphokinase n=1 Tax=Massilia sp. TS11 TaxID=2908003 RepID=UPI001EDB315E|nr:2-amino-4-hydroxy-6-hydroxymethyldihydropteridine diphosphokinase [Massilia sp. TS11]MCG2586466.1 2-amino-4-hydroxy-6-hydroxymethyldihydropteridine diphosphokinase [Massilia sp. TS11]
MIAYIGIGANLGDARATVREAFTRLDTAPACRLLASSPLYRTTPIESAGEDYINAVAKIETGLTPHALLDALHAIEQAHGRERPYRNAPRTLDLDILLYDDLIVDMPGLHIPHPRMCARAFVLVPLLDIAPALSVPGLGPARAFLPAVREQGIAPL